MATGDYANTRFSALDEIRATNATALRVVWTFATGVVHGQEVAPLAIDGTTYVVTPFPNLLYALDLTRPGAPPKWTFNPKPSSVS